mmetsp:Transcript_9212/g.24484  ORF Transcript_9212/g.24484 Transcript_9212/m.24484 type:complete len:287 (-) Transcript_9212:593-1453(-)
MEKMLPLRACRSTAHEVLAGALRNRPGILEGLDVGRRILRPRALREFLGQDPAEVAQLPTEVEARLRLVRQPLARVRTAHALVVHGQGLDLPVQGLAPRAPRRGRRGPVPRAAAARPPVLEPLPVGLRAQRVEVEVLPRECVRFARPAPPEGGGEEGVAAHAALALNPVLPLAALHVELCKRARLPVQAALEVVHDEHPMVRGGEQAFVPEPHQRHHLDHQRRRVIRDVVYEFREVGAALQQVNLFLMWKGLHVETAISRYEVLRSTDATTGADGIEMRNSVGKAF